jgi:hypothetical protein
MILAGVNGVELSESSDVVPHIKRQRSMKYGLYPTGPPNSNTDNMGTQASPPAGQMQSLQLPTRKDSLHNRSSPSNRPYTSHQTSSQEQPSSFATPLYSQHSLKEKPSEASRLRALNNGNGHRSHSLEARGTPNSSDNFSRHRQPSLRHRNDSPKPLLSASTFPLVSHDGERERARTPTQLPETRDRGLSTSSSQSTMYTATIPLRPSTSIPDYHAPDSVYSRQRNLNNTSYRTGRGVTQLDGNYSSQRREPISRPAGFDDEEVRASFRSALTTNSSFLGTSGTERSSVLTKSSSATSVFGGRDEGMSVDDFLGMYETGFNDSGVEDNDDPRPASVDSKQERRSNLPDGMNDSLPVPVSNMIIRNSADIFRNSRLNTPSPQDPSSGIDGAVRAQESYFGEGPPLSPQASHTAPWLNSSTFDSTRDRYGFRKKTQHVTLSQYEAWNGPYTEYIVRRRRKWVALMKDAGLITDRPTRFPPRSAKVKRFVRKGIPPDWRGEAWFYYAGGPAMLSKHHNLYGDLIKRAAAGEVSETDNEIIERDLNRTFPDNIRFKPDAVPGFVQDNQQAVPEPETPLLQSLRRVLHAFSIHNPKIGYCQSLNFLAGLLLLFMDEEKSFWMLNIITQLYLPGTHEVNLEGANVDLGVLMTSIKESMPSVWTKIAGELDGSTIDPAKSMRLPPITLCTTAWFMSCFIGTLPIETVLRVWDSFFYEGSKTLFRVALTIFKLGEQEIKAVNDPMEIFQVVQTIPRRMIDCNVVMEACFKRRNGFGHISQDTIERRREERRQGYADERARANGDAVIVRKGTVFRRKKPRRVDL